MMAILDAGQSTVQNWEDADAPTVPSGQSVARLSLMFPDLAGEFLRALAHGADFDAENPPVVLPTPPGDRREGHDVTHDLAPIAHKPDSPKRARSAQRRRSSD